METDGKINKKRPPPPPVASGECIFPSCPVKLADAVMPDVIYGRLTSSKKECQLSAKECCFNPGQLLAGELAHKLY